MKTSLVILSWVALFPFTGNAQVTKEGNDTLLDIAGWNVEWFGDPDNGPSNEATQYTNVKNVLANTDIDIWGLAEVSNPTTFTTLLTDLAVYDGVLSTFSQTQKTALIWKKNRFTVLSSGNVLTESRYNYDFAGRPPLEVLLRSNDSLGADTFYCYVLHLKANTGSQSEKVASYGRRKNAAIALKNFLDQNRQSKKVIVLGDWNDDLDQSIVYDNSAYLESPFLNFLNDSADYFYPSLRLTNTGQQSTISYPNMIDHQLISTLLKDSFYVKNSSKVLTQLSTQISNYGNSTSDHYPVMARYNMKRAKPVLPNTAVAENAMNISMHIYPNPCSSQLFIQSHEPIKGIQLYDLAGKLILEQQAQPYLNVTDIQDGLYMILVSTANGTAVHKIAVHHALAN